MEVVEVEEEGKVVQSSPEIRPPQDDVEEISETKWTLFLLSALEDSKDLNTSEEIYEKWSTNVWMSGQWLLLSWESRFIPIPDVRSSNPVTGRILNRTCLLLPVGETKIGNKRPAMFECRVYLNNIWTQTLVSKLRIDKSCRHTNEHTYTYSLVLSHTHFQWHCSRCSRRGMREKITTGGLKWTEDQKEREGAREEEKEKVDEKSLATSAPSRRRRRQWSERKNTRELCPSWVNAILKKILLCAWWFYSVGWC